MLISALPESPHGVQTLVVVMKKRCRNADWRSLGRRRVAMTRAETTTDSSRGEHILKFYQQCCDRLTKLGCL